MIEPTVLYADDVDVLAVGLCLLGSGGAGEPHPMTSVLRAQLSEAPLEIHHPRDVRAAVALPVAMVGGPRVLSEKLPSLDEFRALGEASQRWSGSRAEAVMGIQTAGINGVISLIAAIELGVPYVDADLAGRGVPRLGTLTWSVIGEPVSPCLLAFSGGMTIVIDGASPHDLDRLVDTALHSGGGWAAIAMAPTLVEQLERTACVGSMRRALELGRAHATLPALADPTDVAAVLGGLLVGCGRVADIARHTLGDELPSGSITVLSNDGEVIRLETENEYLLAVVDGVPIASCPDLICVLDRRSKRPLAVDDLRRGDEIVVVALPAPAWWLAPEHVGALSPEAFGLGTPAVMTASRL